MFDKPSLEELYPLIKVIKDTKDNILDIQNEHLNTINICYNNNTLPPHNTLKWGCAPIATDDQYWYNALLGSYRDDYYRDDYYRDDSDKDDSDKDNLDIKYSIAWVKYLHILGIGVYTQELFDKLLIDGNINAAHLLYMCNNDHNINFLTDKLKKNPHLLNLPHVNSLVYQLESKINLTTNNISEFLSESSIITLLNKNLCTYEHINGILCFASRKGYMKLLDYAILHNANNFNWALFSACVGGYPIIIEKILQMTNNVIYGLRGACVSGNFGLLDSMIQLGARNFADGMFISAEYGHINIFKHMFALHYGTEIDNTESISDSIFGLVCRSGNMELINLLLPKCLPTYYSMGYNNAAYSGNLELTKMLIELENKYEASIGVTDNKDVSNKNVSNKNVSNKNVSNKINKKYNTALSNACYSGNLELINMMIEMCNDYNWGLIGACKGGNTEIVKKILELCVMNQNKGIENVNYNAGLYGACEGGNLQIVYKMIELGANNFNTGFECACVSGCYKIAKLMVENGANNFNIGLDVAIIIQCVELIDYVKNLM